MARAMQPILIILIFFSGTVFSRYHEKRRFDRAINNDGEAVAETDNTPERRWIFVDYETRFAAYKDKTENLCYLEKLAQDYTENHRFLENALHRRRAQSKTLYASPDALTKIEAWRIAGGRVIDFCRGREFLLLQDTKPIPGQTMDPFLNEIPEDENDIVTRRIADVVLTPLLNRAKREIMLEERDKLNEKSIQTRSRRQAPQFRGRFRGQTQSQYLNVGENDKKEGKAEAEATQQSSRAVVSGSRGMGQAQSMSVGGTGCEDCPGYSEYGHGEGAPDRLQIRGPLEPGRYTKVPGTAGTGSISAMFPANPIFYPGIAPSGTVSMGNQQIPAGRVPSGGAPSGTHIPGTPAGSATYPGIGLPGTYPAGFPMTTGTRSYLPGTVAETGVTSGSAYPGGVVPGSGLSYPGGVPPGITSAGGGQTFPGNIVPGTGLPYPGGTAPGRVGTESSATRPGGMMPGTLTRGGGAVYPGGTVPGTVTTGGGTVYPGSTVPGTVTTGGGAVYPGSTMPGTVTGRGGAVYPGSTMPGTVTTGGGAVYPGSTMPGTVTTGGGAVYPGSTMPGTVTTGGGAVYPGSTMPGTVTSGGGTIYPGGTVTTGGGAGYPGSTMPGTVTTGGGAVYPGSTMPGIVTGGGGVVYPGSTVPGTLTSGGGAVYPGGSMPSGIPTASGVVYPGGSVPGTIVPGSGIYPISSVPTTVWRGEGTAYPGIGVPETVAPGQRAAYPVNIVSGSTSSSGGTIYPGSALPGSGTYVGTTQQTGRPMPGTVIPGSGASYPEAPGTLRIGSDVTYPGTGGTMPGTRPSYPGGVVPSPAITGTYPSAGAPGMVGPGGFVATTSSASGGSALTSYPGGLQQPNVGQVLYPIGAPQSGITGMHGTQAGKVGLNYPGDVTSADGGRQVYPGGNALQYPYPPGGTYPTSKLPQTPGDRSGIYPTGTGVGSPQVSGYPVQQPQYPSSGTWQGGRGPITTSGGQYTPETPGGFVPQVGTGQQGVSHHPSGGMIGGQTGGISQYPGTQYPSGSPVGGQTVSTGQQSGAQYPNGIGAGGQPGGVIQYPGAQYPGRGATAQTGEASQYYTQPGSSMPTEDDGSDSQASSSVKQIDAGTQASAAAQGKFGQGTAQSQVTGTYSGSGSFSAQAGTIDANKSAQTEISGGKEGATSNAQGSGGHGKSQAHVQLDSESGATSTGAQSNGWNHGTNSQVQASSKGGMADAQANGEGSTSSQAQIGFHPYLKTDEKIERQSRPFRGGGTASAQSGTYRGQSQSQLEGSFQYGISYTGAAQAGSGSGAGASRKPFKFNNTEAELFKQFKPYNFPTISKDGGSEVTNASANRDSDHNQDNVPGLQTSSSSRKAVVADASKNTSEQVDLKKNQSAERSRPDDAVYDTNADYDEEYEDEDYDASVSQSSINSQSSSAHNKEYNNNQDHQQSQKIHVNTGNNYDVHVKQDSNTPHVGDTLQPGQSVPGYTVPSGFRGRVTSVSGEKTVAHGDGESQSQTVSLVPTGMDTPLDNKSPISETRSLQTNRERLVEGRSKSRIHSSGSHTQSSPTKYFKPGTSMPTKPNYYTVTNSVAGKMDSNRNAPRKYEHRYYTKSSTCGYFTFSCNIVYGSNGRTKICKPKIPTYPDGTPMKC